MLGKNPTKAALSEMLKAQCEHALLLDHTITTTYAAQPAPTKAKYRKRKSTSGVFEQEVSKLQQAKEPNQATEVDSADASSHDLDVSSLERDAAIFMQSRKRK